MTTPVESIQFANLSHRSNLLSEQAIVLGFHSLIRRILQAPAGDADGLERAREIASKALAGKGLPDELKELTEVVEKSYLPPIAALRESRRLLERDMERHARRLPVAAWQKSVKGFGVLGLAKIVAATGDLRQYETHNHLWSFLGLASRKGSKERYRPHERAIVWAYIDSVLLRQHGDGPYRRKYEHRKAHTLVTHPEWSAIHRHRDATKYMAKAVIKDLWRAWRDAANEIADVGQRPSALSGGPLTTVHVSDPITEIDRPGLPCRADMAKDPLPAPVEPFHAPEARA